MQLIRFLRDNPKLIPLLIASILFLIAIFTGSWWSVVAAIGLILAAISGLIFEVWFTAAVLLAVLAAAIEGVVLLAPAYENPQDRRWFDLHAALLNVEVGSVSYPVREPINGEDSQKLRETAERLVQQARLDCGRARDRALTNTAQDFARDRYIPDEASPITDRIETKIDPNICIVRSRELADLVPEFRPALAAILNEPKSQ